MNKGWVRIILLGLVIMLVLAPFAGLAPLLLVLLVAAVGTAIASLVQVLFTGKVEQDERGA